MSTQKVKDISIDKTLTVGELVRQMHDSGGFTAKKVGIAVNILKKMFMDTRCTVFLSFPACIVATGTRGVLRELIKHKLVDVVITTSGAIDHDIARSYRNYYHGDFDADDTQLRTKNIYRLGNVFIPSRNYGIIIENVIQPMLSEIFKIKNDYSPSELLTEIGKRMNNTNSILYWSAKNNIPVFVPGITDGAFGSNLWLFWQEHKDINLNIFQDEQRLSDIVFASDKTGALMIGGGISKHHTIWWNQFKDGLDYAVYITTAQEYDGSLSGARIKEGISWHKIKKNAKKITVDGDATVILPMLISAIFEYLNLPLI